MKKENQDESAKPTKAGDFAPPREIEQEKKKQENQFVTADQFASWASSFEERIKGMLETIVRTNVSAAPAPVVSVEAKDTPKAVRLQEPLRTPDANEGLSSRPSGAADFYIAPTIEFDRRDRDRDRRMDPSYRFSRDTRQGPIEEEEDHYRRQDSMYDDDYNTHDSEIHAFRRARDAREAEETATAGTSRKKPLRESILKRAIRSVDKSIAEVQVTKVQPRYDNIMLNQLDVLAFAKWSDQIVEYTNTNHIKLPIPTLVHPEIRNFLISHEASLTRAIWTRLAPEEVFSLIMGHLRPKTMLEFYNKLKDNVEFKLRYKSTPTSGNFQHFYDALLLYQDDFTLVFEVLAERNEHNIPPITNKKDIGLIYLFTEKIDTGKYAENVVKTMGSEKFGDMYEFLERFFGIVKGHYKDSLKSKDLNEVLGGSSYLKQAALTVGADTKKNIPFSNYSSGASARKDSVVSSYNKPSSSYSSNGGYSTQRSSTPSRSTHRLNHMMEKVEDASDEETALEQQALIDSIMAAAVEKSGGYDAIEDADVVRRDDDDFIIGPSSEKALEYDHDIDIETQLQHVNEENQLAMIQAAAGHSRAGFGRTSHHSVSSKIPSHAKKDTNFANGCYTLLLHGECKKPDCRFSHDKLVLSKTWNQCAKLLASSRFKPHDGGDSRASSMSHMIMEPMPCDILEEEGMCDPKIAELRQNMFLAAMPEASLHSSMHREGEILLQNDKPLPVFKVLFDTGAIHASYISAAFVDKHADILAPYIRHCNRFVYLADHKTRIHIDRIAILHVNFIGDDEVEHSDDIEFAVFETSSNDMIVGLPAILTSFRVLFRQMLDAAIDAAAAASVVFSHVAEEENSEPMAVSAKVADNHAASNSSDVMYPWSKAVAEEAPEDAATETPCSFTTALHFMEMPHADLVKDYHDMFTTHICPDFLAACPQLLKLLKTKGLQVFVPSVWEGIKGMEPLELVWKDTMVSSLKPAARFVNPKLYSTAEAEFNRLKNYLLRPSTSSVASPLVIAPKATKPFIRLCGDYVAINKYIVIGHYPIPNVPYSLEKICHFKVFLDLDMTNSFHQFRLAPLTSSRLSWQTPWGQYEPIFMPEGIGPASGVLQKAVSEIFADFSEWMICIFDNLLILAMDYTDAFKKLELVLDRCIDRNVCLKFSKSWLGFNHANFFGYVCKYQRYELSESRKEALAAIPFPTTLKKMQSFLGAALFCKSFIPHYSTLTAPLSDMTKQGFNWNETTWTIDYRKVFEVFKGHLVAATSIFYPDYSLEWILRTDASLYGVGAMLIQVYRSSPDADPQYQPIGFASQKFSPQAQNWSTIEQEAYGIYFAVKHFSYYLHCKQFILETDHNNLLWMEASAVPKIIRWRVYLQSFNFMLRHIRGKDNGWADLLSRVHEPEIEKTAVQASPPVATISSIEHHVETAKTGPRKILARNGKMTVLTPPSSVPTDSQSNAESPLERSHAAKLPRELPPQMMHNESAAAALAKAYDVIRQIHNARVGHHGVRNTYRLLNIHFPGHRIPWRVVNDFVSCCPWCQKDRLGMADSLQPIVRHLKPTHRRAIVGVDSLTVTPPDKYGNWILLVIVNHMTKFAALYASAKHDAETTAAALFQFFCSYGIYDSILTDPGSEFMNDVIKHLTRWLGITHKVSLVERHESNGVEGTNKQVLRHLKALVMEERVKDRWSSPTILPAVQFLINNTDSSETGVTPFHATFGSIDATYGRMGEEGDSVHRVNAYVRLLDDNLRLLSEITKQHQAKLIAERTSKMPPERQNQYQPGDLVLWQLNPDEPLPSKLSPKFLGPYEVIKQYKNDVTCKHIVLGNIKEFHVTRLKIFHGSKDEAIQIAKLDNEQFTIRQIITYRGNPSIRTTLEFEVEFEDDSVVWLPWSKDLFDTTQYEDFCRSRSELFLLIHDTKTVQMMLQELRKSPITEVQPGDIVFVDLRCYGSQWYDTLPLPDKYHITYLLEYRYTQWIGKSKLKIQATCPIFKERFAVNHEFVRSYGTTTTMPTGNKFKLIDEELIKQYPMLLPGVSSST